MVIICSANSAHDVRDIIKQKAQSVQAYLYINQQVAFRGVLITLLV
jgi:hypothetical protein